MFRDDKSFGSVPLALKRSHKRKDERIALGTFDDAERG